MDNKSLYFSIIIPCFNSSDYIDRCIKSIDRQTYKNFEVILIDDCSTDETYKILEKYQNKNTNYNLIKTIENSGPATARNEGIKVSKGKYICFLDSDDWWFKNKLKIIFDYTNKYDEEIFCHNELYFENNKYLKKLKYRISGNNFYEHLLLESNELSTSATTVNSKFIKDKNISFNEKKNYFSVEDFDFWLKITFMGARIKYIDKILGTYNVHKSNISNKFNTHHLNVFNVIRDHCFEIQNISKNKSKIWKKASLRFYLYNIKYKINKDGLTLKIIFELMKTFISSPLNFIQYLFLKIQKKF